MPQIGKIFVILKFRVKEVFARQFFRKDRKEVNLTKLTKFFDHQFPAENQRKFNFRDN